MKIVIAGGTGFLGSPLTARLASEGHDLVDPHTPRRIAPAPGRAPSPGRLTAARARGRQSSTVRTRSSTLPASRSPASAGRVAHKQAILDSRVHATRSLVAAIARASRPPSVFVSGSAVGYYGPRGDELVTEATPPGRDFLARVCVQWEDEANRAAGPQTRVVCVRTGLVLERDGGALPQMLPPFKFGAGGPVGSGRQYWPWIHRADWIDLVRWSIETAAVSGPAERHRAESGD